MTTLCCQRSSDRQLIGCGPVAGQRNRRGGDDWGPAEACFGFRTKFVGLYGLERTDNNTVGNSCRFRMCRIACLPWFQHFLCHSLPSASALPSTNPQSQVRHNTGISDTVATRFHASLYEAHHLQTHRTRQTAPGSQDSTKTILSKVKQPHSWSEWSQLSVNLQAAPAWCTACIPRECGFQVWEKAHLAPSACGGCWDAQ